MKSAVKALALFAILGSVLAHAQFTLPHFEHVIIVVQENRTPDNLFGAATRNPPNLPALGQGTDLKIAQDPSNAKAWCLGACFDQGHGNSSWQKQYGGGIYNFCANGHHTTQCTSASTCNGQVICVGNGCDPNYAYTVPNCQQETYVSPDYDANQAGFQGYPPVLPYFDIAHKYGFANYFFQTNQGPSQEGHDFLFGGTSAPAGSAGDYYANFFNYFSSDNPVPSHVTTGCNWTSGQHVAMIKPDATIDKNLQPPPCFEHQTLSDLLEAASPQLTWKYYTDNGYNIWTAPNGISHICWGFPYNGQTSGMPCSPTSDFANNVVTPDWRFFDDVPMGGTSVVGQQACVLPNVTWIIPNGFWSDHPGQSSPGPSTKRDLGPDWVAALVNAVGTSTCIDEIGKQPWQDTVILVVWDDWGGFYDHVGAGLGVNWNCITFGCGYTYGFRVPFLVVSKWTPDGYVSGACGIQGKPACGPLSDVDPYRHDFGSILAFVENNFGLQIGGINAAKCPPGSSNCFPFADANYPEKKAGNQYPPLGDFFALWSGAENYNPNLCQSPPGSQGCPKNFESIQVAGPDNYGITYFKNGGHNGETEDPDNDVIDPITD